MNLEGLHQAIEGMDEKHDAAHRRLRETITTLAAHVEQNAERVESNYRYFDQTCRANQSRIEQVASTPVDATKLVLAPRVVVLIVSVSLTIAGGVWASTAGLRSDVRDILTQMGAQTKANEASAKLQELQMAGLAKTVDEMKRRQELQQYEIQTLTKEVLGRKERQ